MFSNSSEEKWKKLFLTLTRGGQFYKTFEEPCLPKHFGAWFYLFRKCQFYTRQNVVNHPTCSQSQSMLVRTARDIACRFYNQRAFIRLCGWCVDSREQFIWCHLDQRTPTALHKTLLYFIGALVKVKIVLQQWYLLSHTFAMMYSSLSLFLFDVLLLQTSKAESWHVFSCSHIF